jgi:hypothetical protein
VDEVKLANGKENVKNALMDHRRALGLCFKCGEKYYSGQQCKVKVHMLIDQENELEEYELNGEKEETTIVEEVVVSMFASSINSHLSTMRFKGKIGSKEVYALLDSGSTSNFVHPTVLQGVGCIIVETNPIVVMMTTGIKVITDISALTSNSPCKVMNFVQI